MAQAQTDVKKLIPADSGLNLDIRGEFVFLKNAAGKIRVTIHNEPVEMEAGDYRRVIQPFSSVEVQNLTGVDQLVEFVIGFGEYNRLIVRGDISAFPSVLGSDGIPRPDTREAFVFDVGMTEPGLFSLDYLQNQNVFGAALVAHANHTLNNSSPRNVQIDATGNLLVGVGPQDEDRVYRYSSSGTVVDTYLRQGPHIANNNGAVTDVYSHPVLGWVGRVGNLLAAGNRYFRLNGSGGTAAELMFLPQNYGFLRRGCFTSSGLFCAWGKVDVTSPTEKTGLLVFTGTAVKKIESGELSTDFDIDSTNDQLIPIWPDRFSPDHVYFSNNMTIGGVLTQLLYRVNVQRGTSELIRQYTGGDINQPSNVILNYQTGDYVAVFGNLNSQPSQVVAMESGDFWGRGKVLDHSTGGGVFNVETNNLPLSDIGGQSYLDETRQWVCSIIGITLGAWFNQLGRQLPSDYMDYVHEVKVNGRTLVRTGYESFKRAGVDDIFTVTNPCRIELSITQELQP